MDAVALGRSAEGSPDLCAALFSQRITDGDNFRGDNVALARLEVGELAALCEAILSCCGEQSAIGAGWFLSLGARAVLVVEDSHTGTEGLDHLGLAIGAHGGGVVNHVGFTLENATAFGRADPLAWTAC